MSDLATHIKNNLYGYLIPIAALLCWGGIVAIMDERHDPKGASEKAKVEAVQAVKQVELRQLKRELRTVKDRQRLAPDSTYSASRAAEIDYLTDEISALGADG